MLSRFINYCLFSYNLNYFIQETLKRPKNVLLFSKISELSIFLDSSKSLGSRNNYLSQKKLFSVKTEDSEKRNSAGQKTPEESKKKIHLFHENKEMSITLEQAQKLAKKNNLILCKVDKKAENIERKDDVYKLVTVGESLLSDAGIDKMKDKKMIRIKGAIADHDLNIKLNQVKRLSKSCKTVVLHIHFVLDVKENIKNQLYKKIEDQLNKDYIIKIVSNKDNVMNLQIKSKTN